MKLRAMFGSPNVSRGGSQVLPDRMLSVI